MDNILFNIIVDHILQVWLCIVYRGIVFCENSQDTI